MGDFYFNDNSLEELRSRIWKCESSLKTLSEEAKQIFSSLESQRGMGIEEIRQMIHALSVQTANLSGSMGDTAYLFKMVASYVQEAEQKSVKDLEGGESTDEKDLEQPPQAKEDQQLLKWILQENKNGNPFLNQLFYDAIFGEVDWFDLAAIGFTQDELIGKGLIAGPSGGVTVLLVEESIADTLSQYASVPREFDEGKIMKVAQKLHEMGMEWTGEAIDTLLSQDEFKDLAWCKSFKHYAKGLDVAGKVFDFSKFTAEQITKFMVDYEESIAVLNTLKANTPEGTQTMQAIDNLLYKYNNVAMSVFEDVNTKGINLGIDYLKTVAGGGAVAATLDAVYEVTGFNDYAENVLKVQSLQVQNADIYNGFSELKVRIARGEAGIEPRASEAEYQQFTDMFKYLKENKIQEYQILKELTNNKVMKEKLNQQIEYLKNYEIGKAYGQ